MGRFNSLLAKLFFFTCEFTSIPNIRPPTSSWETSSLLVSGLQPLGPVSNLCHTPLLKLHQSRGHWEITQSFRLLWTLDRVSPRELPKILSCLPQFQVAGLQKKRETKQKAHRRPGGHTAATRPQSEDREKAGFLSVFKKLLRSKE